MAVLPQNFVELKDWFANFLNVLETHVTQFGMVETDLTVARNFCNTFADKVTTYATKKQELADASAARTSTRDSATAVVRPIINRISNHPAMTEELRSQLGLKPRNIVQGAAIPITELVPVVVLEAKPGQVMVHFGPNPLNESRNGKPEGVKYGNIYRKKVGEETFHLVGYSTSSPYVDYVAGTGADYTYVVRYRGSKPTELSAESDEHTIAARGALAAA